MKEGTILPLAFFEDLYKNITPDSKHDIMRSCYYVIDAYLDFISHDIVRNYAEYFSNGNLLSILEKYIDKPEIIDYVKVLIEKKLLIFGPEFFDSIGYDDNYSRWSNNVDSLAAFFALFNSDCDINEKALDLVFEALKGKFNCCALMHTLTGKINSACPKMKPCLSLGHLDLIDKELGAQPINFGVNILIREKDYEDVMEKYSNNIFDSVFRDNTIVSTNSLLRKMSKEKFASMYLNNNSLLKNIKCKDGVSIYDKFENVFKVTVDQTDLDYVIDDVAPKMAAFVTVIRTWHQYNDAKTECPLLQSEIIENVLKDIIYIINKNNSSNKSLQDIITTLGLSDKGTWQSPISWIGPMLKAFPHKSISLSDDTLNFLLNIAYKNIGSLNINIHQMEPITLKLVLNKVKLSSQQFNTIYNDPEKLSAFLGINYVIPKNANTAYMRLYRYNHELASSFKCLLNNTSCTQEQSAIYLKTIKTVIQDFEKSLTTYCCKLSPDTRNNIIADFFRTQNISDDLLLLNSDNKDLIKKVAKNSKVKKSTKAFAKLCAQNDES